MPHEESAFFHLAVGNEEAALAAAQRSIELDPEDSDQARLLAARALSRLERWQEAIEELDRAAEVAGEDQLPIIVLERGRILERQGDLEGADAAFVEALRLDPVLLEAAIARFELAVKVGYRAGAEESLRSIRSIAPDLPRLADFENSMSDLR